MELVFGVPLEQWDTQLEKLLNERETLDELMESEEDSYLPYFVNRTVGEGILSGTLADLALLIWFGEYSMLGDLTMSYAMRAFALASGLQVNWDDPGLDREMNRLRELAD